MISLDREMGRTTALADQTRTSAYFQAVLAVCLKAMATPTINNLVIILRK